MCFKKLADLIVGLASLKSVEKTADWQAGNLVRVDIAILSLSPARVNPKASTDLQGSATPPPPRPPRL